MNRGDYIVVCSRDELDALRTSRIGDSPHQREAYEVTAVSNPNWPNAPILVFVREIAQPEPAPQSAPTLADQPSTWAEQQHETARSMGAAWDREDPRHGPSWSRVERGKL